MSEDLPIFLDFDGVLNRFRSNNSLFFQPECIAAFNLIIDAVPNARIVVSSTWRHLVHNKHMDLYGFGYLLQSHGIHGILRDVLEQEDSDRQFRIARWLTRNGPFASYVILDDRVENCCSPSGRLHSHAVMVNSSLGLTPIDAQQAILILQGKLK